MAEVSANLALTHVNHLSIVVMLDEIDTLIQVVRVPLSCIHRIRRLIREIDFITGKDTAHHIDCLPQLRFSVLIDGGSAVCSDLFHSTTSLCCPFHGIDFVASADVTTSFFSRRIT